MGTFLANWLRDIAANPTPQAVADLRQLASMVERLELSLDDTVARAPRGDEKLARLFGL